MYSHRSAHYFLSAVQHADDSDILPCVPVLLLWGCKVVLHLVLYGNPKINISGGGQYGGSISQCTGDMNDPLAHTFQCVSMFPRITIHSSCLLIKLHPPLERILSQRGPRRPGKQVRVPPTSLMTRTTHLVLSCFCGLRQLDWAWKDRSSPANW